MLLCFFKFILSAIYFVVDKKKTPNYLCLMELFLGRTQYEESRNEND